MAGLGALKRAEGTARVELEDHTGEVLRDESGAPLWIDVHGNESAHFKRVLHDITDRNISKAAKARSVGGMKSATLERQEVEKIARCIENWYLVADTGEGEQPIELTEKNAIEVLTEYPAVREQLALAMQDRQRFLGSSSKT